MSKHHRDELRPYQVAVSELVKRPWDLDAAKRLPGALMAIPMGGGKTVSVLTGLVDLLNECVIEKALIVAPLLPALTTWPDEIEDWSHTKTLTYTVIRVTDSRSEVQAARQAAYRAARDMCMPPKGANKDADLAAEVARDAVRGSLAAEPTEIHIIPTEWFVWLWKHFGEGRRWPYDVIVWDDGKGLRSGSKHTAGKVSESGKKQKGELSRFGAMAKARRKVAATIELTGTPTPKGLQDLWGQIYCIDLGQRLGTTKTAFEERWFVNDTYARKLRPRIGAQEEITERVKDIMFSLDLRDHVSLPPVTTNIVKAVLPDKAMAEYRAFERSMVAEAYDVEAVNRGVLLNKLLQFANGSLYQEDGNDVWVHDAKIEALERIREEIDDEPLLIAYTYRFDIERLRKKFPKLVVLSEEDPRETIRLWNAGKIRDLAAHPASAGHGLNMQFGGHHCCWYGLTPDLELYMQMNARLPRPGQEHTVFNHHIIAAGTIDERVLPKYLNPKAHTQSQILEAVRLHILQCDNLSKPHREPM